MDHLPYSKKRAFISFDYDNDQFLRTAIIGQAKNDDSPFEIADGSIKKPFPEYDWEQRAYQRVKNCDLLIVMVGKRTWQCEGVLKEIQMAKQASIPYFGIHGYSGKNCPVPAGLDKTYLWTWDNVKALIDGDR